MSRVLLLSEDDFRRNIEVSESLNSQSIISSIDECQSFHLATVIGDKFLKEIKSEISTGVFVQSVKELLDEYIQPFLLYQSAAILSRKINYRIGNIGVVKDQAAVDPHEIATYYEGQAGQYLNRLCIHLSKNYSTYSQWLTTIDGIKAHLDAYEDTGIFTGHSHKVNTHIGYDPGWRR